MIDPAMNLQVELTGESFAGQVLQIEQRGLVVYEQSLPEGSFRLLTYPLIADTPLMVKVKSPDQPDKMVDLPIKSSEKRSLFSLRPELLALAPTTIPKPLGAQFPGKKLDEDIEFEMDFLKGNAFRNLTPLDVKRLGSARPGNVDADIYRNGRMVSRSTVKFAVDGSSNEVRPCISPKLFQQFGVKTAFVSSQGKALSENTASASTSADCLFIDQWVAGASTEFDNANLRLDITIAQAFLAKENRQSVPPEMLTRGENAGFINYTLNSYSAQGSNSNFLSLKSGANIEGWQLRYSSFLSQSTSSNVKTSQFVSGDAYIRRPLIDLKASLLLGNISTNSPIIGSTPLRGVSLRSEEGLLPDEERSYRPVIKGVARTNARVRVSQNNVVIFEQTVPPGPFQFDEFNTISSVGNLQVVIAEADGSQQTFVVPYSQAAGKLNPGSVRYSVATGMYRNFSSTQNTPVLQAYVRYGLNEFWSPGVEILLGSEYRNVGLQASFNSKLGSLTFNSLFSNLSSNNKSGSGFAQNVNYTSPAWGPLAVISGLGTQSFKYTTPSAGLNMGSTALFTNDAFKYNAFVGLSSNLASRGGLSLSVNQQRNWNDQGSQQVRLSYGVNIKTVFLGINLDRTTFTDSSPSVKTLSASASVPLDFLGSMKGQLRGSFIQTGSEDPSQTLSYYGNNSDSTVSYSLNETKTGDNSTSGASVDWSHDYGNLGASVSSSSSPSSDSSTQYSLTASGGLVLHRGGVLATPSLGDTFAILEVPNGKGVSVAGSTGRINSSGYGVVTYLSPYYVNDVQISLEGASTDLEVEIPTQKVAPVEGSISRLKFNTNSGRPLLIIFQTSTGVRVPIGATVTDSTGLEVGTVGQGSRALVRINKTQDQLSVTWGNAPDEKCLVDFVLDAKTQANSKGFTNLKLACVVGAAVDKTAQK